MEEMISGKINSIIKHITSKPDAEITLDDYSILASELRDIRFRKSESDRNGRFQQLMSMAFPTPINGIE